MKYILFGVVFLFCSTVNANMAKYCGDIKTFRIWATGSDSNGIWVEYESNPSTCPGGFYLPHQSDNKDYVVSFLLAEKAQKNRVCMQVFTSTMISNRCKVNYVYSPE
jgi:hypothetical protein